MVAPFFIELHSGIFGMTKSFYWVLASVTLPLAALGTAQAQSTQQTAQATNAANSSSSDEENAEEGGSEKMCRTFRTTGSRVKRERICLTKAQWETYNENGRRTAGSVISSEGICVGGECSDN